MKNFLLKIIFVMVSFFAVAYAGDGSAGSVDWALFYKNLPIALDDDDDWDDNDDETAENRATFVNLVGFYHQKVKLEKDLSDGASKNQTMDQAKLREIQKEVDKIITAFPAWENVANAAAQDPEYESIVYAIDHNIKYLSSAEFEKNKDQIIEEYAQCIGLEDQDRFFADYRSADGYALSKDQENIIRDAIVSQDAFEILQSKLIRELGNVEDDQQDKFLSSYRSSTGKALSINQKDVIKNSFLSSEQFEAIKNDVVEKYLTAPSLLKGVVLLGDFDGKYLTIRQKYKVEDAIGSISEETILEFAARSLISSGFKKVTIHQLSSLLKGWGVVGRVSDLERFTVGVNQAIDDLLQERKEAEEKQQDHYSGGSSEEDIFISDIDFDYLKKDIIKLYSDVVGYLGLEKLILNGSSRGKKLSDQQKKIIVSKVDKSSAVEHGFMPESSWEAFDQDEFNQKIELYESYLSSWNEARLRFFLNRFAIDDFEFSFVDVRNKANNNALKKYGAKTNFSRKYLSNETFEQKKLEIFRVYKSNKHNPLLLSAKLKPLVGVKQLSLDQIKILDEMIASEDSSAFSDEAETDSEDTDSSFDPESNERVVDLLIDMSQLYMLMV